jgi:hypothetical protein
LEKRKYTNEDLLYIKNQISVLQENSEERLECELKLRRLWELRGEKLISPTIEKDENNEAQHLEDKLLSLTSIDFVNFGKTLRRKILMEIVDNKVFLQNDGLIQKFATEQVLKYKRLLLELNESTDYSVIYSGLKKLELPIINNCSREVLKEVVERIAKMESRKFWSIESIEKAVDDILHDLHPKENISESLLNDYVKKKR